MNMPTIVRRRWVKLIPVAAILAVLPGSSGPEAGPVGVPDDWSHRHVVFSNPGTALEAMRAGSYARWARIVNDPRYILQQQKRAAAARAVAISTLSSPGLETGAQAEAEEEGAPQADFPVQEMKRGVAQTDEAEASRPIRLPMPPRRRVRGHRLQTDWSEDLGSGATLGMGVYAAKFSFSISSANCDSAGTPDFVVYNTGLAGTGLAGSTQASIVAFDNLYSGCSGSAPMNYWAYDTDGAKIVTSVILSFYDNGQQVAFVQSKGGAASLVVLKWKVNHAQTPSAPGVLTGTAPAMYRSCAAPCMTEIPFSGLTDDTGSSPFVAYGADVIFVGDDSGVLHKFTGVFAGTPTEVTTSPWPELVSANSNALSSPVIDTTSGNLFVGDHQASSAPNCGLGCGFLYRVNPVTAAVVQSAQLETNFGIVDAPLLDPTAGKVYVFAGADANVNSSSSPCGAFLPCSGVYQLSTTFSSGASGTEETLGLGNDFMLAGTVDNEYYTSANPMSPTGHLYVLGQTSGDITLYQIPITSNAMGVAATGPVISANSSVGSEFSPAMPVSEIFTATHDYIFTSALYFAAPAACGGATLANGCVMGFDVTSGTISGATTPTGATAAAGGVSGINIDNISGFAGASNIYYTPLADQMCPTSGGTGGCAIQISQSAP
jgi:hypothetical protein